MAIPRKRLLPALLVSAALVSSFALLDVADADPIKLNNPKRRPSVAQTTQIEPGAVDGKRSKTADLVAAMKDAKSPQRKWSASTGVAKLADATAKKGSVADGLTPAGQVPVWVGAADAGRARAKKLDPSKQKQPGSVAPDTVTVAMAAPDVSTELGLSGPVFDLAPAATGTERLEGVAIQVDYSSFSAGGGWGGRAKLVALPACALTSPRKKECQTRTAVESVNDTQAQTLTAFAPSAGMVFAATAAASGAGGDFKATSLAPSGQWTAGGSAGDFGWSYPLRVPQVGGGLAPELAVSYSAQSVDGRTSSTNNQPSWIGEGWDLSLGSIERSYKACGEDMAGDNNNSAKTGDQCWSDDQPVNASFGNHSGELIQDGTSNQWRLRDDDGTRFEKTTTSLNSPDNDAEAWKVTTSDGIVYYFGRGQAHASGANTASTWTVPVYGNHAGEPCHESGFAGSSCQQAWRWNLDHVVDPHGNTMTAYYVAESNRYGRNNNDSTVAYNPGGYLSRIEYGTRSDSTAGATARVSFTVKERCLETADQLCTTLSTASAAAWPDVPQDQICTSTTTCPDQTAPTYFSRKRLTQVKTELMNGTTATEVERWTFDHRFPDPGDGTSAALWLESIQNAGAGGASALPLVQFGGTLLANRVDGVEDKPGMVAPPLNKYRIQSIKSEAGGEVVLTYSAKDCTPTSLPVEHTNTRRCFPAWYMPDGETDLFKHWFHKYLVTKVVEHDRSGGSDYDLITNYTYLGDPAWRYDDTVGVKSKRRTWSQWAGYGKVRTIVGDPAVSTSLKTETLYYRGLDGDRETPTGGTKSANVTDTEGTAVPDKLALQGEVREVITFAGTGSVEVSGEINDSSVLATTATNSEGRKAQLIDTTRTRTRTSLAAGGYRRTDVHTHYDSEGYPDEVDDAGDISLTNDDSCARTTYARNTTAGILDKIATTASRATRCADWPASPTAAQVLEESRIYYDGQPLGQVTTGLPTKLEAMTGMTGNTVNLGLAGTNTYDSLGRTLTTTDILGRTTTNGYTPAGAGVATQQSSTGPDPDGAGPLSAHVTKVAFDPRWGAPTTVTGPDGGVTAAAYDLLGRITGVWKPDRPQATFPTAPNIKYAYLIRDNGPSAVTTDSLKWDNGYLRTISLYDGLLRERQTQTQSVSQTITNGVVGQTTGRTVADTTYDDRGLVIAAKGPTFATGAPASTYASILDAQVPTQVKTTYDGAGRKTKETLVSLNVAKWSTSYAYGGDRVDVTPPAGGTATTSITDSEGKVTALRQCQGATPTGAYDETTYTYNGKGQLATTTDPAGNTWTSTYDILGRLVQKVDPDAGTTSTTYDLAGQVLTETDARGKVLAYTYDNLGRQTSQRDNSVTGAKRTENTYDTIRKGYPDSASRFIGTAAITEKVTARDAAGRPLTTQIVVPAIAGWVEGGLAKTYTSVATYHPDGSPKTVHSPTMGNLPSEILTTTYDTLGRPSGIGGDGSYVGGAIYSAYGQLLQIATGAISPNVSWTTNVYEEATRRLTRTYFDRETQPKSDYDIAYGYNQAGALVKMQQTNPNTSAAADTQCFTMDHLQRLTRAWTPASGDCIAAPTVAGLGGPAPYWRSWTFDKASNRKSQTAYAAAGNTVSTWTYPAVGQPKPHQATTVAVAPPTGATVTAPINYDAAGNVTGRTSTAGAVPGSLPTTQTLTWNAEGRLDTAVAGSQTVKFADGADGSRLLRVSPTTITLYLGNTEINLNRATSVLTASRHISFGGQTVAVRTGPNNNQVVTQWSDLNNTASWQVNRATNAISTRRTLPYGEGRGTQNPFAGSHGFVDGVNDATFGFVTLGAREYDPASGKFLSPDPIIDLASPTQWNPYGYGNGNPIIHPDPSGLLITAMIASEDYSSVPSSQTYRPKPKAKKQQVSQSRSTSSKIKARVGRHAQPMSDGGGGGQYRSSNNGATTLAGDTVYVNGGALNGSHFGGTPEELYSLADRAVAKILALPGRPTVTNTSFGHAMVQVYCEGRDNCHDPFYLSLKFSLCAEFGCMDRPAGIPAGVGRLGGVRIGGGGGLAGGVKSGPFGRGMSAGGCRGPNSFPGDTLVLMADGTYRRIDQLKPDDVVLATDPETGETGPRKVELTIHGEGHKDLVTVVVDGQALTATDGHEVWTVDRGWVEADHLKPGDQVLTATGGHRTIDAVRDSSRTMTAYNLRVADLHSYYVRVGDDPILVHNCGKPTPDDLSSAGRAPDRNGLTAAGRAAQKHGDRGGDFGKPTSGKASDYNDFGQDKLDDLLTAPNTSLTAWKSSRYGEVIDYRGPKYGARFSANGEMMGFL